MLSTITEAHDVWVVPCGLSTCTSTSRDPQFDGWVMIGVYTVDENVQLAFDTPEHFKQWAANEF